MSYESFQMRRQRAARERNSESSFLVNSIFLNFGDEAGERVN